jgi:U3 small nucleolar RNA-associated protein 20
MVFNTQKQIRDLCSTIFIQFLLDYPLSNERIEQHLNFILKNLGCKRIDGRIQLLTILKSLIEKFPKEIVDLYCELIFFTLLLRVVNDETTECRLKIQEVMKVLIITEKVTQSKIKNMLKTVLMMGSNDPEKAE